MKIYYRIYDTEEQKYYSTPRNKTRWDKWHYAINAWICCNEGNRDSFRLQRRYICLELVMSFSAFPDQVVAQIITTYPNGEYKDGVWRKELSAKESEAYEGKD